MPNLVTIHFLFVFPGTRSTGPTITPRWLCNQRWLDATHMKEPFTSVTLNSVGAAYSLLPVAFKLIYIRRTLGTSLDKYRIGGQHP